MSGDNGTSQFMNNAASLEDAQYKLSKLSRQVRDSLSSPGEAQAVLRGVTSYMRALGLMSQVPNAKAREPYSNHVWTYATATIIAKSIQSMPFGVFIENDESRDARKAAVMKSGHSWRTPIRMRRRAVQRWMQDPRRMRGARLKGVDLVVDHPFMDILLRPNPLMDGTTLMAATSIFLTVRGACMWLLLDSAGKPVDYLNSSLDRVAQIWPMDPAFFDAVKAGSRFLGWRARLNGSTSTIEKQTMLELNPSEVVHFKYFNPYDPIIGLAPITPAASHITTDLMADEHTRTLLANDAEPGGVLTHDEDIDPNEQDKAEESWKQRNSGLNRRSVTSLTGGWKFLQTAWSPKDMEFGQMHEWDRDALLAVTNVPRTKVSVTEKVPYATAQVLEKQFLEDGVLPIISLIERTIDSTLFYSQDDKVFAMFDLSQVEALKAGLSDKISMANAACNALGLRMPPKQAAELAGIDVEDWPASDEVLVPPSLVPVQDVVDGSVWDLGGPSDGEKDDKKDDEKDDKKDDEKDDEKDEEKRVPFAKTQTKTLATRSARSWLRYIRMLQGPAEITTGSTWRRWTLLERREALSALDIFSSSQEKKVTRALPPLGDIMAALPSVEVMRGRLRPRMRNLFEILLPDTYEYTVDELGVSIIALDDPALLSIVTDANKIIVGSAPDTIEKALRKRISAVIEEGGSFNDIREAVKRTYKLASSPYKTTSVARTESTRFISTVRDRLHADSGVKKQQWITAGDEHVRATHEVYGAKSPQPRGTNWLKFTGSQDIGVLEFPGDSRAPSDEIMSCRCVMIATG